MLGSTVGAIGVIIIIAIILLIILLAMGYVKAPPDQVMLRLLRLKEKLN